MSRTSAPKSSASKQTATDKTAERGDLIELYNATATGPAAPPSYNVAPSQDINMILERPTSKDGSDGSDGRVERQPRAARWGWCRPGRRIRGSGRG
jgi:putative SOS response-associated peptidase YedK